MREEGKRGDVNEEEKVKSYISREQGSLEEAASEEW